MRSSTGCSSCAPTPSCRPCRSSCAILTFWRWGTHTDHQGAAHHAADLPLNRCIIRGHIFYCFLAVLLGRSCSTTSPRAITAISNAHIVYDLYCSAKSRSSKCPRATRLPNPRHPLAPPASRYHPSSRIPPPSPLPPSAWIGNLHHAPTHVQLCMPRVCSRQTSQGGKVVSAIL